MSFVRRAIRALGVGRLRQRLTCDVPGLQSEIGDLRAFRAAAEAEIAALKGRVAAADDQLSVEQVYASALASIVAAHATGTESAAAQAPYASCPWIEGGVSFIPGRLRVCPNSHVGGGTPGLVPFTEGPLPVAEILVRREIIQQANRLGGFAPCVGCAFRRTRQWEPRQHAFDLLCIAHATACNLACSYCHSIPEAQYLQNPSAVPRLYPTIAALIADGQLAPGARVQWGGGEPTILREFDELFRLLDAHGANSEVYTSGVRIPRVLLDAMTRGRAGVMISLDAGTPETYARIKGRAVFERVVSNVARYAAANPGRTLLKMILSERNIGEVSRFLDVAERAGVRIVCVDTLMYEDRVDDRVIEAAARFCTDAQRRGLESRLGEVGSVYNPGDRVAQRVDGVRGAAPGGAPVAA